MSPVAKSVENLFADCEASGHFDFVGKLSRIHPQAAQGLAQTPILLTTG